VASRRKEKRTDRSKLDATPPWETRIRDEPVPTEGPFDERDAPEDDVARIDVRLEMNEAQQVIAVTLAAPTGHMQLGVFAAPRNESIWDEVRAEIASSMRSQSGAPKETSDARFGTELSGKLPGDGGGPVAVRFIGVDGPRWFLRAMLVGAVATDKAKAAPFEQALRQVVVVRGAEPLPVREPVPLRLPKELSVQSGDGEEQQV